MPRIRSIHPGIFTDEAFMSASAAARLLIIGLWCEAWDDGVFEWKPLTLKARVFPADHVDMTALLGELEGLRFLTRFSAGGRDYGAIRNFQKFQRPKKPNSSGVLPNNLTSYVGASRTSSETMGNQFGTGGEKPSQMEDGGGKGEEEGEEQVEDARGRASPAAAEPRGTDELGSWLRTMVGEEPVLLDSDVSPIERLLENGCTRADVAAGIKAAMDDPSFRIRAWKQLKGWIQRAAKDRLGQAPKGAPTEAEAPPDAAKVRRGQIAMAKGWIRDERWSDAWGPRRGEPGCPIPDEIWLEAEAIIQAERTALKEALSGKPNGSAAAHH